MQVGREIGSMLGASLVVAAAVVAIVTVARADSPAPGGSPAPAGSPAPMSSDGGQASAPVPSAAPGAGPSAAPSAAPGQSSDPLSPERLLSGPSLYETGRVGTAPQAAPKAIEPQEVQDLGREKSVDTAAASIAPPAPRAGVIDQAALDQQIENRFAALQNCRVDVARQKRVPPNEIVATTLTLRWTIRPNGTTADTVVVASNPVDLEVMSCVKSAMMGWKFMAPRGGPVRLERVFNFRALQELEPPSH
jgi:hypothetical protein